MVSLTEPLAVMVADCVPVVLVGEDPAGAPVLGVVHAGRPGVAAGVVPAAVARLRELGADRISAWVGPSVCGRCYEVPGSLRADVAAAVPATWCTTSTGTPGLDLPAGVRSQLEAAGVAIEYSGGCTLEDDTLFSYRRNSRHRPLRRAGWSDGTHGTDDGLTGKGSMAMTEPAQRPDAHAVEPVTAPGESHENRTDALEGPRLAQLEANLAAVRRRIDAAVAAAGRQAAPPRLIVVTKFHPAAGRPAARRRWGSPTSGRTGTRRPRKRRRSFRTLA